MINISDIKKFEKNLNYKIKLNYKMNFLKIDIFTYNHSFKKYYKFVYF